jgi:hypothetical protein
VQNALFSKIPLHVENHYDIKYIIHCNFNAKFYGKANILKAIKISNLQSELLYTNTFVSNNENQGQ